MKRGSCWPADAIFCLPAYRARCARGGKRGSRCLALPGIVRWRDCFRVDRAWEQQAARYEITTEEAQELLQALRRGLADGFETSTGAAHALLITEEYWTWARFEEPSLGQSIQRLRRDLDSSRDLRRVRLRRRAIGRLLRRLGGRLSCSSFGRVSVDQLALPFSAADRTLPLPFSSAREAAE